MQDGNVHRVFGQRHRLGDLQVDPPRRQAGALQCGRDDAHQVAALELQRRQVHRHTDVRRPAQRGVEGAVQHPFADGLDQAGFLGQRDEGVGHHHAMQRVAPAQQGFEADHLARPVARPRVHGHDRLVVEFEFAVVGGAAQVDFKAAPALRLLSHQRPKQAVGTAPGGLRVVQRQVGAFQQLVGIDAVVGRQRDAHARAHQHLLAADDERQGHRLHQPFGQRTGGGRLRRADLDHRKFVAAEPRDQVGLAHALTQPQGHDAQQFVADRVAERVVDGLEAVEVDAQQGHRLARAAQADRLVQPLAKAHPVRQAGQLVVVRHALDLGNGAPLLGDVVMGRDPAAVGHRLVVNGEAAAVPQCDHGVGGGVGHRDRIAPRQVGVARHLGNAAGEVAAIDDLAQGRAWRDLLQAQPVHLGIAPVADDQALLSIEEAQAL